MTVGEYAQMLNGEGWLKNSINADLTVIKCKGYTHKRIRIACQTVTSLPNRLLYICTFICWFEGTNIHWEGVLLSLSRFTDHQIADKGFSFIPESVSGQKIRPFRCEV